MMKTLICSVLLLFLPGALLVNQVQSKADEVQDRIEQAKQAALEARQRAEQARAEALQAARAGREAAVKSLREQIQRLKDQGLEGDEPAQVARRKAVEGLQAAVNRLEAALAIQKEEATEIKAIAVITPFEKSVVKGWVRFLQKGDDVEISGEITGLKPGKHGFHIHELGDISGKDGLSTGGHFNPLKKDHGAPTAKDRHVGDLGNIEADENGKAVIKMTDKVIRLSGPLSIVGRAVIIHADPDDYGQPVGHAGARVAGGVVGYAK